MAVRLLRKYLYKQLKELLEHLAKHPDQENLEENVFEINPLNIEQNQSNMTCHKPIRLKKCVNFHLFISSAPCGDGRIFAVNDKPANENINL